MMASVVKSQPEADVTSEVVWNFRMIDAVSCHRGLEEKDLVE